MDKIYIFFCSSFPFFQLCYSKPCVYGFKWLHNFDDYLRIVSFLIRYLNRYKVIWIYEIWFMCWLHFYFVKLIFFFLLFIATSNSNSIFAYSNVLVYFRVIWCSFVSFGCSIARSMLSFVRCNSTLLVSSRCSAMYAVLC